MSSPQCEFLAPDEPRWASFLGRVTHDFYHLPSYVLMCAQMENAEAGAFYVVEGGNEFLLPVMLRKLPDLGVAESRGWRDAMSPYGYPGPLITPQPKSDDASNNFGGKAIEALLTHMRERHILTVFARFHPLLESPLESFGAYGTLVKHGHTVSIDLTLTAEQIWSGLRMNHQRQIKTLKQRSAGRTEEDLNWSRLPEFIAAYKGTMDRVQAAATYYFDENYFSALRQALGTKVHLMVTEFGGQLAAGVVLTECCGIVQYHLAATTPQFFKERPQKLLCCEAWLWSKSRGDRIFHLGGGVGGKEDNLFHFKAGFSDLRHPFYTWRACSDPGLYQRLIDAWHGQNPGGSSDPNFFPTYRQRGTAASAAVG